MVEVGLLVMGVAIVGVAVPEWVAYSEGVAEVGLTVVGVGGEVCVSLFLR